MCKGIAIGNQQSAKLRYKNRREYLVAPMSMIRPGIHSGSSGPIYYPAKVLEADPERWNGVPITLGHPKVLGQVVSAATQPKTHIGFVSNTKWIENALRADAWIDTSRAPGVLLQRLREGHRVEVSTGLQTHIYKKVVIAYEPDHLAILTDEIGACSVRKGCGLLAGNARPPRKRRGHKEHPLIPQKLF